MSENDEINILTDIYKWIRFLGWSKAKDALDEHLKNDVDRLIYHYSDGEHGIRDIISIIADHGLSTSFGGVHGRWQRWARNGLLMPKYIGAGIRYVKIFKLEDFGIEIPEKLS